MLTRDEIHAMILEEIVSAKREISTRSEGALTRDRLRQMVVEEATKLAREGRIGAQRRTRLSLIEAMNGGLDEAGPGIILSDPRTSRDENVCEQCGGMYEMPMAKCPHCGATMDEYIGRGLSSMGKLSGVDEAKRKRKSMTNPPPKDDPSDLGGMSRDTAKSMVAKIARAPGPTFSNITDYAKDWGAENPAAYAGTLMRSAAMEPARGPKLKGKGKKKG
jgi:hypothetical protein